MLNCDGVSPELLEKAKACTSCEELLELALDEGHPLSDEVLEHISGSAFQWKAVCAKDNYGDERTGIDPALAHEDFVNGLVDGGEFE